MGRSRRGPLSNELAARIQARRGNGTPLDHALLAQMENAFGTHLNNVRLHDDDEAHALSRRISAKAFTIGSDIFFGRNADPSDMHLLIHELAHVVQQRSMGAGGPMTVGPADDSLEREAERTAATVTAQLPVMSLAESSDQYLSAGPDTTYTREKEAAVIQRGWLEGAYDWFANISGAAGGSTSLLTESAKMAAPSKAADFLANIVAKAKNPAKVMGKLGMLGKVLGPIGAVTGLVGTHESLGQVLDPKASVEQKLKGGGDLLGSVASTLASLPSLGPAGLVASAFSGGYAVGTMLDKLSGVVGGALSKAITGKQEDWSLSGLLSSAFLDESVTKDEEEELP